MKRLLIALALTVTAATARADLILGLQYGEQSLDYQQTVNGVEISGGSLETDGYVGLVVGAGTPGGNSRFMFDYVAYDLGNDNSMRLFNVGYVRLVPIWQGAENRLRAFGGLELGYGSLKMASQPFYNSGSDSGLQYGVRTGLSMGFGPRVELELGVRASQVGLEATQQGLIGAASVATTEIDSTTAWWTGVNFSF